MINPNDVGKIVGALGLLASTIKSGEPWTKDCQHALSEALDALNRISTTSPTPSAA